MSQCHRFFTEQYLTVFLFRFRIIWTLVQVAALWGVVKSVTDVYDEYMSTPTVTSLETTQYPGWSVPFPAVGFCNVNKISKVKALELAEEL